MLALHLGGRSEPLENAQASERQSSEGGVRDFSRNPSKGELAFRLII